MPAYGYIGAPGSPNYLRALGSWPDIVAGTPPAGGGAANANRLFVGSSQSGNDSTANAPFKKSPNGLTYQVHRVYDQSGFPATYNQCGSSQDFANGMISMWSFPWGSGGEPNVVNGSHDALITGFINSIPSGTMSNGFTYQFFMCFDHEPEAPSKNITPSVHKAMLKKLTQLIRAAGRLADVHCTMISTEQQFFTGNAAYPPEQWLDYGDPDSPYMWGCDVYNKWTYDVTPATGANVLPNSGTFAVKNSWSSLASRFSNFIAWMDAHPNQYWGITETGSFEDRRPSATYDKAQQWYDGMAYLSGKPQCLMACYWDNSFSTDQSNNRKLDSSQRSLTLFAQSVTDFGRVPPG